MFIQSLTQIKNAFPQLSTLKTCAMLGCGGGSLELGFVRECMPNITQITAVEPDAHEMDALKTKATQLLPNVSCNFFQETAQSWKGGEEPFDVVLMCHFLYYVPLAERPVLLKKLFDDVVANDGLVFLLTSPYNSEDPPVFDILLRLLKVPSFDVFKHIDGAEACNLMTSVGFRVCYQLPIKHQIFMEEADDDAVSLLVYWSGGKLNPDEVRKRAKEVLGSEKILQHDMWLGIFKKP